MPQDYSIHRVSLAKVSAFLVCCEGKAMLIDSGSAGSEGKILKTVSSSGLSPGDLKLLILTHAHFDHAGSAAELKQQTGCRIVIHSMEKERLIKGYAPLPPGTRWKAKILIGAGRLIARRMGSFKGVEADIVADNSLDLNEFGFPGTLFHTPGHTPGSMVVLMDGGELFAGDTMFGITGKEHFPPFAEDLPALLQSWERIRNMQIRKIYPAHGIHFSRDSFLMEYERAQKKYG